MEALAAAVVGLVSPYLVKGVEEFAKATGEAAFDKVQALVERLQEWWSGDPVANATAANLATNPKKYSEILSDLLRDRLLRDQQFARDIQGLVDASGPYVEVIQRMEIAEGVTGADIREIVGGHLSVTQEVENAQDVTGVKVDRLG